MIRFLLLVALFFLAVLGFDWLKDAPGEFALTLNNTVYVVGLARAMAGLIAVIAAIMIVLWLASFVWRVPSGTLHALRGRKNNRGREALSRGLIAVAAGDVHSAERASAEAAKIAPGAPLTMLLQAQTAQMKGDADIARTAFTAMLDDQRTQIAGMRGLHVEADRAGEADTARHFATKARELTHQAPWANRAMLRHQIAEQDWAGALATLSASADARNVDRKLLRRHRAVILTAQAIDIEESEPQTARKLAIEAHGLAPELAPAATVAGRLLTRLGEIRRAVKILETSWKAAPHPEIANAYAHVRSGDSARDRLKRIESLARMRPQADEGRLAVTRAAIDARDWSAARAALAPVLKTRPTQNALILMSEVEEAEHGDRGRAREWLARAVHASRDPVWIADGIELDAWAPVSPVSGRIDAVEWRIPTTQLGAPEEIDLDFASDDTASTSRLSVPAILPAIADQQPGPKTIEIVPPQSGDAISETRSDPQPDLETEKSPAGTPAMNGTIAPADKPAAAAPQTPAKSPTITPEPAAQTTVAGPSDAEPAKTESAEMAAPDIKAKAPNKQPATEAKPGSGDEDGAVSGSDPQPESKKSTAEISPGKAASPVSATKAGPSDTPDKPVVDPVIDTAPDQPAEDTPPDPISLPRPDDPGVAEEDEDPDGANRRFRIF